MFQLENALFFDNFEFHDSKSVKVKMQLGIMLLALSSKIATVVVGEPVPTTERLKQIQTAGLIFTSEINSRSQADDNSTTDLSQLTGQMRNLRSASGWLANFLGRANYSNTQNDVPAAPTEVLLPEQINGPISVPANHTESPITGRFPISIIEQQSSAVVTNTSSNTSDDTSVFNPSLDRSPRQANSFLGNLGSTLIEKLLYPLKCGLALTQCAVECAKDAVEASNGDLLNTTLALANASRSSSCKDCLGDRAGECLKCI